MPRSATALVRSLVHIVHRPGQAMPFAGLRVGGVMALLRRAVETLCGVAPRGDLRVREIEAAREAELVEARLLADHWRTRAEASALRAAALEVQLADSEMTALDLRSRLVCLHGKLATTAATARYQTLALALEHQLPAPPAAAITAAIAASERPRA